MAPEVRVAISYHHDSTEVARQLHHQLCADPSQQDPDWQPGWGLLFATERYVPAQLLSALKQCMPDVPLYGGSVVGQISHETASLGGYGVQLLLFPHDTARPTPILAEELSPDPYGCGLQLAAECRQLGIEHHSALLFFDALSHSPHRSRVSAQRLIDGLNQQHLLNQDTVAGCALLANEELSCSWLVCGDRIIEDAALMLLLPPGLQLLSATSHGNRPISRQLEVTASHERQLQALNGRPALEVMQQLLDIDPAKFSYQPMSRLLTLGQWADISGTDSGSKEQQSNEQHYLSRPLAGLDPVAGALLLDDAYLRPGDKIQFMCRDQQQINRSLQEKLDQLEQSPRFEHALLALYINCSGRFGVSVTHEQEDVRQISQRWPRLPLSGIYTAGELAKVGNKVQSLHWTGVITVLCWVPDSLSHTDTDTSADSVNTQRQQGDSTE